MKRRSLLEFVVIFALAVPLLRADTLDDLAADFWAWRANEQPISTDDIPRLERPKDWLPEWSPAAVSKYQAQLKVFEARWKAIDSSTWPVSRQVDYRLIGSALARTHWELNVLRNWQRNPNFYVDQTAGAFLNELLPPPPFDAARSRHLIAILASIPATLENAKVNLTEPAAPFAQLAMSQLDEIRPRMKKSFDALKPHLERSASGDLDSIGEKAIVALDSYRDWLKQRLPSMASGTAVGREAYIFFLKNVALEPFTPEQLLAAGHQEWARSVASQTYEEHRNLGKPPLSMFMDQAEAISHEEQDERAVRAYLEEHDLLTIPAWMQHYRFAPMPDYVSPLDGLGELDDFTSPSRLKENGTRYIGPPSPDLGYFGATMVRDPRGEIVHEGVPGHYFQLALSWAHPDPIRRHYYDSGANEGIGFYAEEMMLHAGLFDDSPRSREFIWNFMRLRALRVEVDVKLALGQFTISQAADYLQKTVPMDSRTAHAEAAFFASGPGQAISYQIGKLQIYDFLAEARRQTGDAFSLRRFHDFLWLNGNVPIALLRWEFLGLHDDLDKLETLR
ncbi:MAG TPA: DUF885 domain-containing protein [Terriglobales bacterium]|nr:DUF885 domain-containing protein [Terriglobales bacterium]